MIRNHKRHKRNALPYVREPSFDVDLTDAGSIMAPPFPHVNEFSARPIAIAGSRAVDTLDEGQILTEVPAETPISDGEDGPAARPVVQSVQATAEEEECSCMALDYPQQDRFGHL